MHQLIAAGDVDDKTSDAELTKIALGTFEQAVGPFAYPCSLTEAMFKTISGERIKEECGPTFFGQATAAIQPLVKVVTPKFIDLVLKRREYEKSLEKYNDYAIKPNSLATWPEGEIDVPANLGLKRQRLDLTAGTRYAINNVVGDINGASSRLNKYISSNPNLNQEDAPELLDLYEETQIARASELQRLKALVEDYEVLFGDDFEFQMEQGLSKDGAEKLDGKTQDYISDVRQNYFTPYELERRDIQIINQSPIPYQTFDDIYRAYDGARIE